MSQANALLVDAFGRIRQIVHRSVEGLEREQLTYRIDPEANTIAWLVWHLTRIQDDHVAGLAGSEQVWHRDGWYDRFGLPFDRHAHGFGHSSRMLKKAYRKGASDSQLITRYATDPLMGGTGMNVNFVTFEQEA